MLPNPMQCTALGVLHSPFKVHLGTPRQPGVGDRRDGRIEIYHGYQNLLKDLDGFSHVWVLGWLHHAHGWNDLVQPPRDDQKRGLFATRSPHRPNPIGLSVFEIRRIEGRHVHIGPHDLHDGTPILDLKPYLPYADAIPDAHSGWVGELGSESRSSDELDHRPWPGARPATDNDEPESDR